MTLRLKAPSRTFPFPTFDGCAAWMQYLLGKGGEVWKEWRASLWYTGALADGILQPNAVGGDSIASNGGGITSSLPQLGVFFFNIFEDQLQIGAPDHSAVYLRTRGLRLLWTLASIPRH